MKYEDAKDIHDKEIIVREERKGKVIYQNPKANDPNHGSVCFMHNQNTGLVELGLGINYLGSFNTNDLYMLKKALDRYWELEE